MKDYENISQLAIDDIWQFNSKERKTKYSAKR